MDTNVPRPRRAWYQWHWFTWIVVLGLVAVFFVGNLIGIITGAPARVGPLVWTGGFPVRFLVVATDDGPMQPIVRPGKLALNILIAVVFVAGAVFYLERRFLGQRSRFSIGAMLTAVTVFAVLCALARWEPSLILIPICGVLMLGLVGIFDSVLWLLRLMFRRLWRGNRRLE